MARQTLSTLFPGVEGRMELVRVMIHLRMPDLRDRDRDEPIDPELVDRLLRARREVRNG